MRLVGGRGFIAASPTLCPPRNAALPPTTTHPHAPTHPHTHPHTPLPQVNPCKKKALTNMRAAGKDATVVISEPIPVTLDYALEFINSDELVEVRMGEGAFVRPLVSSFI